MPLSYIIRKDTSSTDDGENINLKIIHKESLVRNMFIRGSRKFLGILKELTLGADSKTWIKGHRCVKKVIQELQAHYDGTSENETREIFFRSDLKKIFYKNETTSPNTELKTEVNIPRLSHLSTFVKASTYLSTVVAIL